MTKARLEQADVAQESFTKAVALNPNLADAYLNRGVSYDRQAKKELACRIGRRPVP